MEYLIYGLGAIFVIYKVTVYFGRKNAIDVLCHNYQLSREKVSRLKDVDITRLTFTIDSANRKAMNGQISQGERFELNKLLEEFR